MGRQGRVLTGVAMLLMALLGWLITEFAAPFAQRPRTVEDLTPAWVDAGPTRLGAATTVSVPPDQTVVAFLVGTDLYGIAGTTSGSCTATGDGRPLELGWPVQINRSLTGVLRDGQETVAIAGWTNRTHAPVRIELRCDSRDSTVSHYVAVPTRTAVITRNPWFQPWGWIGVAVVGVGLILSGVQWISPPSR